MPADDKNPDKEETKDPTKEETKDAEKQADKNSADDKSNDKKEDKSAEKYAGMSSEDLIAELKAAKYEAGKYRNEKNELKAKTEAYEKEKSDAEAAKMKEQGEWQKLAEQREKELTEFKSKANQRAISSEIKNAAIAAGVTDAVTAKLISIDKITVNDDGEVVGAAEAVKAFQKEHPDLFKTPADPSKVVTQTGIDKTNPNQGSKGTPPTAMDKDKDGNFILSGHALQMAIKERINQ